MLWRLAWAVTLNGALMALDAGEETATLFTFTSLVAVAVRDRPAVTQLFAVLLSAGDGGGVMAMQFCQLNEWLLGWKQWMLTMVFTVTIVDLGSVWLGMAPEVEVQSAGGE